MIIQSEGKLLDFQARSPFSDYWYEPLSTPASTGLNITNETALTISAVWACTGIISETLASMPLPIYERAANGDRDPAVNYYLYNVIHDQPNRWQTSMEFREMLTGHLLLRGNAYAYIKPGRRGFAEELIPLNPARMYPRQQQDRSILYRYTGSSNNYFDYTSTGGANGPVDYTDEEIFHLRGRSRDGIRGMSVIEYARESFGLALATEQYGGRFFGNGARPGGVLKSAKTLNPDTKKRLKEEWQAAHGGVNSSHKVAVLEEGMEWQAIGLTNEDSQFLQTRAFQVEDVARWFRVPLFMIQSTEKVTSWGSGIEQQNLGFIAYTLLPWAKRWEGGIRRDLIIETSRYYAEHVFESLLRGDIKSRFEAYQIAAGGQAPWMTRSEVRRRENLAYRRDMDEPLKPLNMGTVGETTGIEPALVEQSTAHYDLLLHEAAGRIARKEATVLSKAAKRCASDGEMWRQAVEEFFEADHAELIARTLQVALERAAVDVAVQCERLLQQGAQALEDWEVARIDELVRLAKQEIAGGVLCHQ